MPVLLAHLRLAMDPRLPGGDGSYLAFWDPAVLAALLGQSDPDTQTGIDPVLRPRSAGPCWGRSHAGGAGADRAGCMNMRWLILPGLRRPCRFSSAPLRSMRW
jgi:hypothetical protein